MDRREQAKQLQKQRISQVQSDNDAPQQPLFGVPKKVSDSEPFSKFEFH